MVKDRQIYYFTTHFEDPDDYFRAFFPPLRSYTFTISFRCQTFQLTNTARGTMSRQIRVFARSRSFRLERKETDPIVICISQLLIPLMGLILNATKIVSVNTDEDILGRQGKLLRYRFTEEFDRGFYIKYYSTSTQRPRHLDPVLDFASTTKQRSELANENNPRGVERYYRHENTLYPHLAPRQSESCYRYCRGHLSKIVRCSECNIALQ